MYSITNLFIFWFSGKYLLINPRIVLYKGLISFNFRINYLWWESWYLNNTRWNIIQKKIKIIIKMYSTRFYYVAISNNECTCLLNLISLNVIKTLNKWELLFLKPLTLSRTTKFTFKEHNSSTMNFFKIFFKTTWTRKEKDSTIVKSSQQMHTEKNRYALCKTM